jgi:hypothetical protein
MYYRIAKKKLVQYVYVTIDTSKTHSVCKCLQQHTLPVLIYKTGAQNKQFFHFPKSAEQRKKWIEVLVTSGIPPSKL